MAAGYAYAEFDLVAPGDAQAHDRRLPQDEWLFPNITPAASMKFDETGGIIETMGDLSGVSHPMVTSMREHKGWLYVGGILNNRIGCYRVPGADPD